MIRLLYIKNNTFRLITKISNKISSLLLLKFTHAGSIHAMLRKQISRKNFTGLHYRINAVICITNDKTSIAYNMTNSKRYQ